YEIGEARNALTGCCGRREAFFDESRLESTVLAELNAYAKSDAVPLKPQRILHDMRETLSAEDILISDVGVHKLWIARLFPAELPNTVIISNGFATMGIGVPGGIAAKIAEPKRRVVVVTGDGGFLMNVQELETARRLSTAFVTVVWVDGAYGSIQWQKEAGYGRSFGVGFGNAGFVTLAQAFGRPALSIS